MDASNHSKADVASLIADLDAAQKPAIRKAVDALIALAQTSAEVRDRLHRRLREPHINNPWAVAYILAQLPQPSHNVIQQLLEDLAHPDADIRWAIGLLLVRLATRDQAIERELRRLCAAGNAMQRRMAIYCLRDLNLQDGASAEVFFLALRDVDPLVRIAAAAGLKKKAQLDAREKDALLTVFVKDPDSRVRSVAAVTLAQAGAPSEVFLQALNLAAESEDEQMRRAADAALSLLQK
jgi:hypothetical protein